MWMCFHLLLVWSNSYFEQGGEKGGMNFDYKIFVIFEEIRSKGFENKI